MAFEDFWFSQTEEVKGASLRFNGGQYLSRSFPVGGDRTKWTFSVWVKRFGPNAGYPTIFGTFYDTFSPIGAQIRFAIDAFTYSNNVFTNQTLASTNALFRDPGAWTHYQVCLDTANAVASDRYQIYINGVRASVTASYPPLNDVQCINAAIPHYIGAQNIDVFGIINFFSGYMSDVFFVGGQNLPTTDFGQFDANGVWVPLDFATAKGNVISAGGFGTNGFALEFESANFNSGTLVWADQSGNGNDWTANWDCAAGSGGGTAGTDITGDGPAVNYAVINPLYTGASTSNANLTTANTTGKPSILPAFANSGSTPQIVGVNGAGVSWNGTAAGWTSTGDISFGQQSTFTSATGLSAVKLSGAPVPDGSTGFQALLASGASILTTAQAAFPNGLWWVKDRVNVNQHQLVDSINTSASTLYSPSNTVGAYTAPAGNSVAWAWATPASGINTSTGFSITTGTHGLGQSPQFAIDRQLNVYHASLVGAVGLKLSTTAAAAAQVWTVNSTTISGPAGAGTYYSWAPITGYSSFGSYTGNGSVDGPFAYCGFLPAFVLIKCSSTTGNWEIYDNARNTYNPETLILNPDLTNAESTVNGIDFLSNGFKVRTADANFNTSGQTYIYAAFAENPFGGSNVAPVTAR
jgi:hypothetical protein